MDHFYQELAGWFDFEDLYRLAVDRAPPGARFLEVGSYYGASAAFLAVEMVNAGKGQTLTLVDPWGHPLDVYEKLSEWITMRELRDVVLPLRGTTLEVSKVLPWWATFDFIFIDADHSYFGVSTDLAHWWPRLKKGGHIAGHDLCPEFPGVEKAVADFCKHENREFSRISVKCWQIKGPK